MLKGVLMKPLSLPHLAAPWCVMAALVLGSCASSKKADPDAPAGEAQAAQAGTSAETKEGADSKKQGEKAADKKEPKPEPEKKDGEKKAAGEKPEKPADKAEEAARKEPEAKPEEKKEPEAKPVDPLKAEEFKGLSKDEAAFILACRAAGASAKGDSATGRDGVIFSSRELRALGANPKRAEARHQEIVAAISQYAAHLKAAGIEFVLTPVPPKAVVYPDYLGSETKVKDKRLDAYLEALYADLKKAGVRVVDVTKPLRAKRFAGASASFPRAGVTWSPAAVALAADETRQSVKRSAALKKLAPDKTISSQPIGVAQNGESFRAVSVGRLENGQWVSAPVPKEGAPIIVIGDDNAAAFRTGGQNAGLGDQLSLALGAPVETRASAATDWKSAAKQIPAAGSPTKLVVWNFSAATFLDLPPAPAAAKPAPKRRISSAPREPRPSLPSGGGLRLRDDPGLEIRPE